MRPESNRAASQAKASPAPLLRVSAAVLVAASIPLFLLQTARAGTSASVVWNQPTHVDGFRFDVSAGTRVSFTLKASTTVPGASVHIVPVHGLPQGAEVSGSAGKVARSTFSWSPTQGGDYTIRFTASTGNGKSAPLRSYTIHVRAKAYTLTNPKLGHWAPVLKQTAVRAEPRADARRVSTLQPTTGYKTQNLVLVLEGIDPAPGQTWYRVRLAILPNNSTGWVPASALGQLYAVHTHIYVDRAKLRLTLTRDGRTIFTSIVGVGKPYWPTPRGQFYLRNKLTSFDDPFYGPIAFVTSARSAVLTDWPGGGYVGIHGTSLPELLPGQVSHGCIRMLNADIVKLASLIQVGTPLTIR
jgi:lipoprotein-anchoring transpeptidase ErfK/SrfK